MYNYYAAKSVQQNLMRFQPRPLHQGTVEKAVSSTPTTVYGHGPTGTFSYPGMDQFVFNAMMLPNTGLQSRLPFRTTNETNPVYSIVTGITAHTGSNPTNECDDAPAAGMLKLCKSSGPLGRFSMQTRTFNLEHFGELTNRGEFMDLSLIGNPLMENATSPTMPGVATADAALRNEAAKALFELASSWAIKHAPVLYTGSPTNNTAGGGYREYNGLETLVNDGYRDVETGVACAAADSIIQSFGNARITSATADIVGKCQRIAYMLRHISTRTGMGNTRWVWSMHPSLFYDLSEVWAYYYYTRQLNNLTFNSSFQLNLDGADVTQIRDTMRGDLENRVGQFLIVDGRQVEVVLDDSIPETEITPGVFTSDIYMIPLTVRGGVPVTYMEAWNWGGPGGPAEAAQLLAPGDSYRVSDQGAFFWHRKPPVNLCVEMITWNKPRLVLRTPYLAARISNIAWSPTVQHERSPFHSSGYFVNGGATSRAGFGPSFLTPTS